jgi:hypothetical protein
VSDRRAVEHVLERLRDAAGARAAIAWRWGAPLRFDGKTALAALAPGEDVGHVALTIETARPALDAAVERRGVATLEVAGAKIHVRLGGRALVLVLLAPDADDHAARSAAREASAALDRALPEATGVSADQDALRSAIEALRLSTGARAVAVADGPSLHVTRGGERIAEDAMTMLGTGARPREVPRSRCWRIDLDALGAVALVLEIGLVRYAIAIFDPDAATPEAAARIEAAEAEIARSLGPAR